MVEKMGRVLVKDALFIMATVILVVIISLLFKGTVQGMSKTDSSDSMEKYYISLEKEYVSNVKTRLADAGYANAGVMLTKVILADGNREYTLSINHKKIAELGEDIQPITDIVKNVELPIENMGISIMTTY